MKKIPLRNTALLGEWLWKLHKETFSLWYQVILGIWETHPNGRNNNILTKWSYWCPWKPIAQIFQFFIHTCFVVGDDMRIHFWEDL